VCLFHHGNTLYNTIILAPCDHVHHDLFLVLEAIADAGEQGGIRHGRQECNIALSCDMHALVINVGHANQCVAPIDPFVQVRLVRVENVNAREAETLCARNDARDAARSLLEQYEILVPK